MNGPYFALVDADLARINPAMTVERDLVMVHESSDGETYLQRRRVGR